MRFFDRLAVLALTLGFLSTPTLADILPSSMVPQSDYDQRCPGTVIGLRWTSIVQQDQTTSSYLRFDIMQGQHYVATIHLDNSRPYGYYCMRDWDPTQPSDVIWNVRGYQDHEQVYDYHGQSTLLPVDSDSSVSLNTAPGTFNPLGLFVTRNQLPF